MKKFIVKIKSYIIAHKIISIIMLIVIIWIGYWGYNKYTNTTGEIQYITTTAQKGNIISSVTASGQIESSNQIDLKADVSGTITYVDVKPGDKITKGKTLFSIDNKDALKSIRDAEINLESAKIAFEKFKVQNSNENMNADLVKTYDDGFNTVSNVFLDLPGIMTGLNDMFFKSTVVTSQWNVDWYEGQVGRDDHDKAGISKQKFIDSYNVTLKAYNISFDNYKSTSRTSDRTSIEALIVGTYDTTKLISDTIKNANNYIDFVNDSMNKNNYEIPSIINTHKAILSTDTSKTNSHLLNLLTIKTNIRSYKDAFTNNDFDTQSQLLSLKQKENSLQDLKDKLSDYYVSAPFNGTIASVTAKVGDIASGTLGSIITNQKIATLSMNEVDVAKIKLGEKATVTFDAIENLSMTGTVSEIDTLGIVSQGVVSYSVKISFDTEDSRIKSGMSVSASIITNSKTDTLIIPSSAVKTQGITKYVLMFTPPLSAPTTGSQGTPSKITPDKVTVETGISDDTNTEIISGLKEGDQVVSRTITNTTKTNTTTNTRSILGGGRGPGL
ncbi:MAG: HlyD family efflux transporter periplasmic adaptor subunit [bacterium]